jgi:predicted short-subunit dehydrogenase-like oxidoreductase (DUF2520 family)
MMNTDRPTLGFVGIGKVGQTLARLLHQQGYSISALWNRHPEAAADLAERVQSQVVESPSSVVRQAAITFLTVSDAALPGLASTLVLEGLSDRAVIHTSGALDMNVLSALAASGAMIGSLHPAYPFAAVESAVAGLPGAAFALEASHSRLYGLLCQVVSDLRGHVIRIKPGDKALYHAALVLASNYGVTLYALAEKILQHVDASSGASHAALDSLLTGMLHNLRTRSPAAVLTGPLVRGDVETVEAHLQALQHYDSALYDLYRQLGLLTLPLAEARGTEVASLRRLLQEDYHDTTDHS